MSHKEHVQVELTSMLGVLHNLSAVQWSHSREVAADSAAAAVRTEPQTHNKRLGAAISSCQQREATVLDHW